VKVNHNRLARKTTPGQALRREKAMKSRDDETITQIARGLEAALKSFHWKSETPAWWTKATPRNLSCKRQKPEPKRRICRVCGRNLIYGLRHCERCDRRAKILRRRNKHRLI
jgi:hypothetical protein